MSTVTLDIAPEVIRKAEDIFQRKGMSYSQFLKDLTEKAVMDFSSPEELPVPCIDDLTDEELMRLFEEGMESIRAGRYYTADEIEKELLERYEYATPLQS